MIRLALAPLTALLVLGCSGPAEGGPIEVQAQSIVLFPDDPGRRGLGDLRYSGGVELTSNSERFGGWSAMTINEDGTRLLAVSDSASWMTADLVYDEAGDLTGLANVALSPMLDTEGTPLEGLAADAEGLADLGNGRFAVSFERDHRIWVYDFGQSWDGIETARASTFAVAPGADRLRDNGGLEALALVGDTLWAGIEDVLVDGQPHQVLAFDPETGASRDTGFALEIEPRFAVTGFEPDGAGGLIVLERFYARQIGNRNRIGLVSADALEAGVEPLRPQPLAAIEPDMSVDNYEAIALANVGGTRRIFLMSDDNFNDAQRTLLISFDWPEDASGSNAAD